MTLLLVLVAALFQLAAGSGPRNAGISQPPTPGAAEDEAPSLTSLSVRPTDRRPARRAAADSSSEGDSKDAGLNHLDAVMRYNSTDEARAKVQMNEEDMNSWKQGLSTTLGFEDKVRLRELVQPINKSIVEAITFRELEQNLSILAKVRSGHYQRIPSSKPFDIEAFAAVHPDSHISVVPGETWSAENRVVVLTPGDSPLFFAAHERLLACREERRLLVERFLRKEIR